MAVRPLIGTGVTPNHLTTLRLVTGVGACAAVALGTPAGAFWGGWLWLISAFLDRADGELARIGDMMSAKGHAYDYFADVLVNSLVFLAAGIGARHGWLGVWAAPLGLLATVSMLVSWVVGEWYQKLEGSGQKAYAGHWGFDVDDGLYLIAPLIWLGLMGIVVAGAAVATLVMAVVIAVRYRRLVARRAREAAARA
ncbi:MAG TPA: CDP-alcohol phosphatidyltransferase family protein [Caulobacteraceae bacterium]|jgi:phosphatidylglycerophosphate synthase